MSEKRAPNESLFAKRWVHVHEEDTAEGHVYRPEDDDIPLSRRPRERLQFAADGTASISQGGANDGYFEHPATWSEEDGALVLRGQEGSERLRVVRQTPERLLVRRSGGTD